jgi:hypothetical protein
MLANLAKTLAQSALQAPGWLLKAQSLQNHCRPLNVEIPAVLLLTAG